jgi:hypothetical protein
MPAAPVAKDQCVGAMVQWPVLTDGRLRKRGTYPPILPHRHGHRWDTRRVPTFLR